MPLGTGCQLATDQLTHGSLIQPMSPLGRLVQLPALDPLVQSLPVLGPLVTSPVTGPQTSHTDPSQSLAIVATPTLTWLQTRPLSQGTTITIPGRAWTTTTRPGGLGSTTTTPVGLATTTTIPGGLETTTITLERLGTATTRLGGLGSTTLRLRWLGSTTLRLGGLRSTTLRLGGLAIMETQYCHTTSSRSSRSWIEHETAHLPTLGGLKAMGGLPLAQLLMAQGQSQCQARHQMSTNIHPLCTPPDHHITSMAILMHSHSHQR